MIKLNRDKSRSTTKYDIYSCVQAEGFVLMIAHREGKSRMRIEFETYEDLQALVQFMNKKKESFQKRFQKEERTTHDTTEINGAKRNYIKTKEVPCHLEIPKNTPNTPL